MKELLKWLKASWWKWLIYIVGMYALGFALFIVNGAGHGPIVPIMILLVLFLILSFPASLILPIIFWSELNLGGAAGDYMFLDCLIAMPIANAVLLFLFKVFKLRQLQRKKIQPTSAGDVAIRAAPEK